MLSSTGKRIRTGRILDPATGSGIVIAYSHSLILGPPPGAVSAAEIAATIDQCRSANAVMIPPGMVDRFADGFVGPDRPSLVVHLDWTNFSRKVMPYAQGAQTLVGSIEEVAAAGADAVMTYLLVGYDDAERDAEEIRRNAKIARACDRLGIALIIEPRYAQERAHPELKTDPEIMQFYCRVSADLGADIVKCIWPGSQERMAEIVESCHAPIMVAGGARNEADPDSFFATAQQAVDAGARGFIVGRNVYQSPDPQVAIARLRGILSPGSERTA